MVDTTNRPERDPYAVRVTIHGSTKNISVTYNLQRDVERRESLIANRGRVQTCTM